MSAAVTDLETLHAHSFLRALHYRFLSRAFLYPRSGMLEALRAMLPPPERAALWGVPAGEAVARSLDEVRRLLEQATPESLESDHVAVFGHTMHEKWPPHETRFGAQHPFQESQQLADIAAFYEAYQVRIRTGTGERPDHLALELEFLYLLALKQLHAIEREEDDRAVETLDANRRFFCEHIGRWAPVFGDILSSRAPRPMQQALGRLLAATVRADAALLDVKPLSVNPEPVPLPVEPDPEELEEEEEGEYAP